MGLDLEAVLRAFPQPKGAGPLGDWLNGATARGLAIYLTVGGG